MRDKQVHTNDTNVIDRMERDVLFAYLELMHATNNIPEKDTYENILKIKNAEALDKIITLIESEHVKVGKFLKDVEEKKKIRTSLFQRILKTGRR